MNIILNKQLNKKLLSHIDITDLNELLQSNLNINDAFDIITNTSNIHIIELIKNRLQNNELIENILPKYTNKRFSEYFNSFKNIVSVKKTIELSANIINKENIIKNKFLNNLKYPMILLLTTIISIICFYTLAFDNLIEFSKSFNQDLSLIYNIRFISLFIIFSIITLFMIIACIYIYIISSNKQQLIYIIICSYLPISIIKEYFSYYFIVFYRQCIKINLKPYETLHILKLLKNKPIVSYLAYIIDDNLENGNDFNESINNRYIDKRLYRFINLSLYTNNILDLLNVYIDNCEKRFDKLFASFTQFIQLFSYLMIGFLIVLVYQIILMPLEIIGAY